MAAIRAARPTEAIDTYRAFELYTSAAAWITGEEVLAGIIQPGNRADLVIFGRDPLLAPVETLPQLEPVCTLLHGQTMFDPEGLLSPVSQGAPEVFQMIQTPAGLYDVSGDAAQGPLTYRRCKLGDGGRCR